MGVKGRDLVLWLYFGLAAAAAVFRSGPLALMVLVCACWIGFDLLVYEPCSRRRSRALGLEAVVLLPVPVWWARFLLWLAGDRLDAGGVASAYEVHLAAHRRAPLAEFLGRLDRDLALVRRKFAGSLVIWETPAPLPSRMRAVLREEAARGRAVWKEGRWPVPRFPLTQMGLGRGRVRRGAAVVPPLTADAGQTQGFARSGSFAG